MTRLQQKGEQEEDAMLKASKGNISMAAGTFNLCKSAIGVGILALPKAMANSGLLLGLGLLALGSITCSSTLYFLARIAANTDLGDYFAVGNLAYGGVGESLAVLATLLYLIGALIGYMSYTTTYISSGIGYFLGITDPVNYPWYLSKFFVIALCAALIFPLACLRDLSKLARASIVGMCCMAFVCGLTVIDYFADSTTVNMANYTAVVLKPSALAAFSTILFAFCNHFTMLSIVPNFISPTPRRRALLTAFSSTVVFIFYLLVSLFGYLHFGDAVADNILKARSTTIYAIARLVVACVILVSYPLLCDPTKSCMDFLVCKWLGQPKGNGNIRNLTITASLVISSALVAMVAADQVLPILGLFSSLCGSLLMFIFPALYFLKLENQRYRISKGEKMVAYVDIVVGAIVLIFGTYFNAQELIRAFTSKSS